MRARASALSIRSLLLTLGAVMLALGMVPLCEPARAQISAPPPQAMLTDCHHPRAPEHRPDKGRSTDTGCLAPCAIPAKEPPQAAAPPALRHIPVPGCQLALRGIAPSPATPPPRFG